MGLKVQIWKKFPAMNSINPVMIQMAVQKAQALDIPPRLLLVAFNSMAENEQATEADILAGYRKILLCELKAAALAQMQSNSKMDRENGVYSLSQARKTLLAFVQQQSSGLNRIDDYP